MFNQNFWFLHFQKEFLFFSFCIICLLTVPFYMIDEIQPKRKCQIIFQSKAPFIFKYVFNKMILRFGIKSCSFSLHSTKAHKKGLLSVMKFQAKCVFYKDLKENNLWNFCILVFFFFFNQIIKNIMTLDDEFVNFDQKIKIHGVFSWQSKSKFC